MCIQRARSGPKAELVTTTQPSSSRPQEHSAVALRLPPSLEVHASLIDIASPTRAGWETRLGDHFRDHPDDVGRGGAAAWLCAPAEASLPRTAGTAGAGIAIAPVDVGLHLDPDVALALFTAPVLLDAACDTSLRDLSAIGRDRQPDADRSGTDSCGRRVAVSPRI